MILLDYLQSDPVVFLSFTAFVGLCVGSFLNVVIYRLPLMMEREWRSECLALLNVEAAGDRPGDPAGDTEPQDHDPFNLWTPRSRCPNCARQIRAIENIPVVSYLVMRGKCAGCRWPIPWRYPGVELLCGLASLGVAWHFGFGLQAFGALLLLWACLALCFIDLNTQLLPDSITLPFLWLGLLFNFFGVFCPLHDAVLGAILGYGILWAVYQGFRILTGKEGMGFGDFKLLAMLAAWQGWQMLPAIILISSIFGAIIGIALIVFRGHGRSVPIPFGPYLVLGGLTTLIWGKEINAIYLGGIG